MTFQEDNNKMHNSVTKLGTLEHLDIFCLTHCTQSLIEFAVPPIELARRLFHAYKHAFYNYSEHFILYYLYRRDQIRDAYSIKDLVEVAVQ